MPTTEFSISVLVLIVASSNLLKLKTATDYIRTNTAKVDWVHKLLINWLLTHIDQALIQYDFAGYGWHLNTWASSRSLLWKLNAELILEKNSMQLYGRTQLREGSFSCEIAPQKIIFCDAISQLILYFTI